MFRKHLETTETLRNEVRRDLEHFDAEFASGDGAVTNHAVDTCRAVESAASGDDDDDDMINDLRWKTERQGPSFT